MKLDQLRINQFYNKVVIPPKNIVVTIPLLFNELSRKSYISKLSKSSLVLTNLRRIYIPYVKKTIAGIYINTDLIIKELKSNPSLEIYHSIITNDTNLDRKIQSLSGYAILDLYPLLYSMNKLFERYKTNYQKLFDLYFKVIRDYLLKVGKQIQKVRQQNIAFESNNMSYQIIPLFILDIKDTTMSFDKIEEFSNKLIQYIRHNTNYEIPIIPKTNELNPNIFNDKLLLEIDDLFENHITLLGEKQNNKYIAYSNIVRKLYQFIEKNIEQLQQLETKVTNEIDNEQVINEVLKKLDEEYKKDENYINVIKDTLEKYIKLEPEQAKILSKKPVKLLSRAFKTIYNVNANESNIKQIIENHAINKIEATEITPVVNLSGYQELYSPDKSLKVKSTVVDIHEREYNERLDAYIHELFKSLEDIEGNKIKVKGYTKELKDDKLNRYYEYTFKILNEDTGKEFDIKVKIPALINNRYFKLNGKTYILANQQFLKPITVTEKNKVRFLSYYSVVHLMLKNYKLLINDINSIIEHIQNKYSKYIDTIVKDDSLPALTDYIVPIKYSYIKFKKPYIEFFGYHPLGGNKFLLINKYKDSQFNELEYQVIYDKLEDKLYIYNPNAKEKLEIPEKLNEYLFDFFTDIIQQYNPEDILSSSKTQLPYVIIHIGGFKIPYIIWMFSNFGITNTLNTLGIQYQISDTVDDNAYYSIQFKDKVVNIYPKTLKQRYIINGLLVGKYKFDEYNLHDFDNSQEVRDTFIEKYISPKAVKMFNLFRRNLLDPITKKLLKLEGYHDELLPLFGIDVINALFNSPVYHPADLRISRARNSEVLLNILYKQLAQAKNEYEMRIAGKGNNHDERIYFDTDYVIKELLTGESLLQYVEPINPIDELNTATRITPKGIGGIPSPAITARHRMIPFYKDPKTGKWISAHFNNVSANDTNEYSNIGVNQQLTWNSLIGSRFGLFQLNPDISNTTFESLGIGESLAPFIQSIDHDRAIKMAQQMRQSLPIKNPDIPLVPSGAELLIPQIVSPRFILRAKDDGVIKKLVPGKYILIEYKNGKQEVLNLIPRIARTKRGLYLPLELIPEVKEGQTVKKGQTLASSSQLTNGIYKHGKNVCVAVMTYDGGGYEDAWVVSEDLLDKFTYDEYKEVIAIIPSDSIVKEFNYKKGTKVKRDDTLIRFAYKSSLDNYLKTTELLSNDEMNPETDDDNSTFIIKNSDDEIVIKSPFDGIIEDVRIYINGKVDSLIEKAWKEIVKEHEQLIKMSKQINNDPYTFSDVIDTSMHKRGGHKWKSKEFQGALIMIFIKTTKKPKLGSKFVFRGGNKGTIEYLIPADKKPIALETGLKIDVIHNPLSLIGRKNPNFLKEISVGKIMYFLNKKAKEMANDKNIKTKDIKKLVIDVYTTLCKDEKNKLCKQLIENIQNIDDNKFRELCKQIDELNKPLFVYFAIPFTKLKEEDIIAASQILNIPIEEKVKCPQFDCVTEKPIAVGFAYMVMLEHEPDSMMGFRSTGKYTLIGQGAKGESRHGIKGAQSLETLTLVGLLDYFGSDSKIIKELYTVQSDDHTAKNDVLFQILNNGIAPEKYRRGETGSTQLARIYLLGLGLEPGF